MSKAKIIADAQQLLSASSMPDRSSTQNLTDRRAIKRALGVPVSLIDYGVTGTTDWTTALQAAVIDVGVNGGFDRRLYIPAGNFILTDTIVMDYPITIFGDHMSRCVLLCQHLNTALYITGKYGTGPAVKDISIVFDTGGGNSVAHIIVDNFQDVGTPTIYYSPDFLVLSGLNLTGFNSSTAAYNIRLNGSNRTNSVGGTVPVGLRNITLNNIATFNATFRGLDASFVRVLHAYDTNIYGAAGVGKVAVYGVNASLPADTAIFTACAINGEFLYSNTNNVKLYGCTYGSLASAGTNNGFVSL